MKRFLIGLLCVCMLLSGCTGGAPQPTLTELPETETQLTSPAVPLLEQGTAVGESGNLLYIPNDAVEDMICPEIRLFGNGLLLSAYIRNQYVLKQYKKGPVFKDYPNPAVIFLTKAARHNNLDSHCKTCRHRCKHKIKKSCKH